MNVDVSAWACVCVCSCALTNVDLKPFLLYFSTLNTTYLLVYCQFILLEGWGQTSAAGAAQDRTEFGVLGCKLCLEKGTE